MLIVYIWDVLNKIRHGVRVFIITSGELLYLSLGLGRTINTTRAPDRISTSTLSRGFASFWLMFTPRIPNRLSSDITCPIIEITYLVRSNGRLMNHWTITVSQISKVKLMLASAGCNVTKQAWKNLFQFSWFFISPTDLCRCRMNNFTPD